MCYDENILNSNSTTREIIGARIIKGLQSVLIWTSIFTIIFFIDSILFQSKITIFTTLILPVMGGVLLTLLKKYTKYYS